MSAPTTAVHSVEDAGVAQEACGRVTLFRFSGPSSPALVQWLKDTLKESKHSVALHLRELAQIDGDFVQVVLKAARDGIRHKRPLALIDPPGPVVEALE